MPDIELTTEQHQQWTEEGYLLVRGLLAGNQATEIKTWVDEVAQWPSEGGPWLHHHEQTKFGDQLTRTEYFLDFHSGLRQVCSAGKVLGIIRALFNEPAVLYKEKINYKYPDGGGYAAHQDAPAFEHGTRHITCAIAVDPATLENGCLLLAPGMHRQGMLPQDDTGCLCPNFAESLDWDPAPMAEGDALFFDSYTPHKSSKNQTEQPRRNLYLTYNTVADGDLRETYYASKRKTFANRSKEDWQTFSVSKIGHFRGIPVKKDGNEH